MNQNDLLSWLGNVLNFIVIVYLTRITLNTPQFSAKSLIISATALLISALINLYTSLNKIN